MIREKISHVRNAVKASPLAFPPGHFYSPICNPHEIQHLYDGTKPVPDYIDGVDLNSEPQRDLWASWAQFLNDYPFPDKKGDFRFYNDNEQYGPGDATVLYCMLRHFRPARFFEIGSGFSSACALDTMQHYLGNEVACTFIEPHPELLRSLITTADLAKHTIIPSRVQNVPLGAFDALEANDILLIDSTHILKTGSDVVFELFEVLPRLKPGVIVHFHDMFYPFEYPKTWAIDRNYSWNEIYAVRAFLTNNADFEIVFFNDHFGKISRDLIERDAPHMLANAGGSLWLRRASVTRPPTLRCCVE